MSFLGYRFENLTKTRQKLLPYNINGNMLNAPIPTSIRYGIINRIVYVQAAMKKRGRFLVFPNNWLNNFLFVNRMALVMATIACANQPVTIAKVTTIQTNLHIVGGITTSYPRTIEKYVVNFTGKTNKHQTMSQNAR